MRTIRFSARIRCLLVQVNGGSMQVTLICYTVDMKVVDIISVAELSEMSDKMYGSFVKAVVDLEKGTLVVDAEMHADEEQYLLENGSVQSDLWGINLHPDKFGTDEFIEFDSLINIRPRQQNRSRNVESKETQRLIIALIKSKVTA